MNDMYLNYKKTISLIDEQVENIIKQKNQPGIDVDSLSSFSLKQARMEMEDR